MPNTAPSPAPITAPALSPAEVYESRFVPALFAQWGPVVAEIAGVGPGMQVLDVGCGTGALTRAAARLVGEGGAVTGLDPNPEMLAVAATRPEPVDWVPGRAEALPFADRSFDAVVSQFAMMFFEDRPAALREMRRVARPGGRVAAAVCGDVDASPGYGRFAALLDLLFGRETGDAFRAPFVLGQERLLLEIAEAAGIGRARVEARTGTVRFASVADLVSTERACAWTLGGLLDHDQFERLLRAAADQLAPFVTPDGAVEFDMPALILTFAKG